MIDLRRSTHRSIMRRSAQARRMSAFGRHFLIGRDLPTKRRDG